MIVAPPWSLRASGYAVVFAPQKAAWSLRQTSPRRRIRNLGGFGLLLLLDYERSEVGPYTEVLYIPGYASIHGQPRGAGERAAGSKRRELLTRGHSISWIVVSTEESRDGGIANWGIPKRIGSIESLVSSSGQERFFVTGERGDRLLSIRVPRRAARRSPLSRCSLPINSLLLPHTLVQPAGPTVYETRVEATVRLRAARRATITGYTDETAEIASRRVLATFNISRVRLRFPPATKH